MLPRVEKMNRPFIFCDFRVGDDLYPDVTGVPSPVTPAGQSVPDVIIVPSVAFDGGGQRLGMGGGFYDRTLPLLKNACPDIPIIGYGFDCQMVDCVPTEPFDVPIDAMVTEKQVYEF